jgi:ATP-dependent DNA helicase RecG
MRASDTERVTHTQLMANAFFRAGYIESWGRGIEKIRQECLGHDIEPPVYDFGMAGLMLTFRANPEHLIKAGEGAASTPEMPEKTAQETAQETSGKMSGKMSGKISGKIVELIAEKPDITIPELAAKLKRTERTIERLINRLKAEKVIGRVGPAKGGHWKVIP